MDEVYSYLVAKFCLPTKTRWNLPLEWQNTCKTYLVAIPWEGERLEGFT